MIHKNIKEFSFQLAPAKRLLGIDIGARRIGIALSDVLRTIATPHSTIIRKSGYIKDINTIINIIKEHDITGVVSGYPIQMNGLEGESCLLINDFLQKLTANYNVDIYLQDERLSTAAVKRVLNETNLTRKKKNDLDDKMSACYILQCTLDLINNNKIA